MTTRHQLVHQVVVASGWEASSTSHVEAVCLDPAEASRIALDVGWLARVVPLQLDDFASWLERTGRSSPGRHSA